MLSLNEEKETIDLETSNMQLIAKFLNNTFGFQNLILLQLQ